MFQFGPELFASFELVSEKSCLRRYVNSHEWHVNEPLIIMRHLRLTYAYSCYAVGTPWFRVCIDFVSSLSRFLCEFCLKNHLKVKQNSPQKRDKLNITPLCLRRFPEGRGRSNLCFLWFQCDSRGETAGVRGRFCRGKREFDTGKLELRGRQKQFGRPSQYLRSGAQISWGGRANPFFVFDYLQTNDN